MKKIIFQSFLAFSLMQTVGANAQLTVKGASSFVYVGDELLYVDQSVNLDGGNIYLRRDGQLIQGTTGTTANSKTALGGSLSAFVMSNPTNRFNYTHYGLPVSTTNTPGKFVPTATSIGAPRDVTVFRDGSLTGSGSGANDGLAAADGYVRLNKDFISWYEGSGAYSSWKYPILNAAQAEVPQGYGLYFKGTSGSDATEAGEGKPNKASDDAPQRIEFRGVPNDGRITIAVENGKLYSLGNPYPSAFNLNKFMYDNKDVIESVAFYIELNKNTHLLTNYNYGYATYTTSNPTGAAPEGTIGILTMPSNLYKVDGAGQVISDTQVNSPKIISNLPPFIGIGTGFWIKTKANGTIVFNNLQRVNAKENQVQQPIDPNDAARNRAAREENYGFYDEVINLRGIDYTKISKAPSPTVGLLARTNSDAAIIGLVFNDNAQDTYMHLSDIPVTDTANFNMYIEGADNKYKLKNRKFNSEDKIPVTIESKGEQAATVSVDNTINFKLADNIYLYDEFTGVHKDILNDKASITVPAGITKNRYFITFSKDNGNLVDESVVNNAFVVLQNNKARALTINNPEALDVTSAEVFDIQGKLVLSKKNLGTDPEFRFSTSNFADGIYVVKIATKKGQTVTKKVIIKN